MGTGHVGSLTKKGEAENMQVVAVCDVYQRRVNRAKEICKGDGYIDYRRLLDRNDIDAGPHRHPRPLACQALDRCDGGRQARLLRKAADAHSRTGDRRAGRGESIEESFSGRTQRDGERFVLESAHRD
jgi:hypothetical protein